MQDEAEFLRVKGLDTDEIFGTVEPVTEEKEDMIDFGLLENEKAAQHIDHQIDECIEGTATLESFSEILKASGWDGVSKQTAAAMAVALRRIDRQLGDRSALTIALEDETSGDIKRIGSEQSSGASEKGLAGRAKDLWQKFVAWFKEQFEKMKVRAQEIKIRLGSRLKEKYEKVKTNLANYNHNGPSGGLKITVPAGIARIAVPGGKHEDMTAPVAFLKWLDVTMYPWLTEQVDKFNNMTGSETIDQIEGMIGEAPVPPELPGGTEWHVTEGMMFKPSQDDIMIPVRTYNERKAALAKINVFMETIDTYSTLSKLSRVMTDMIRRMGSINLSAGPEVYNAMQAELGKVRTTSTASLESYSRLFDIGRAVLDVMKLEDDAAVSKDEVSNEEFDYGLEDANRLRKAWERMVQFFKELWEKGKARWEKLRRAPEVIEAKIETTKEEVKKTKQAEAQKPADAQKPEEAKKPQMAKIDTTMATRIFNERKVVMPSEFLEFGKYVTEQIPAALAPIVEKLEKAFAANDAETISSLKAELPAFNGELPNGNKINFENGTAKLIIIEAESFEFPSLDFDQSMKVLDEVNTQNSLGEREKSAGKDVSNLNVRMSAFNGEIIKHITDDTYDASVKAGMEAQKQIAEVVKGAQELTRHYYDCMYTYLTLTLI